MKSAFKKTTTQGKESKGLSSTYSSFDKINGRHPWQEQLKDQVVLYPVRELDKGQVTYFNYRLAKEMGLISKDHPNKMNKILEKKIIKTFSIQIINEYEQNNNIHYDPTIVKKNLYMATRYLQIQHESKTGKTSGDGRGIWNGVFQHNGRIWDISSRGTGVTKLAPGAVKADRFLQTGNGEFGYGCGQMEIDELYGTAISSEIFHHNKISTERVLAIIDLGKGIAIGIRAAPNLLRPAHLMLFLKQGDFKSLKTAVDYFIHRQSQNKEWYFSKKKNKYDQFLEFTITKFAKFIARLDADYIFTWIDWDGDNILANAGIIDYGSIRQFGVRHDQYRYDDVEKFSTTLSEQKAKVRHLIRNYIQMVDFIKTGKKKNINSFRNHPLVHKFNNDFEYYSNYQKLYNIGFQQNDIEHLLLNHRKDVLDFIKSFSYFESIKTKNKPAKVADGINHPAIFNMRDLLRELPKLYIKNDLKPIEGKTLFDISLSTNAGYKDRSYSSIYDQKYLELQMHYLNLIECTKRRRSAKRVLLEIENRSKIINRPDRATGNAIINVVDKIVSQIKAGFSIENIQELIEGYVDSQMLLPEKGIASADLVLKRKKPQTKKLLNKLFLITNELKDEI